MESVEQKLSSVGLSGINEKQFDYLCTLFMGEADVDDYIRFLDTDENIDLTKRKLTWLKDLLEGFKVMKRRLETKDFFGPNVEPEWLLEELETLDTEQKKFNHLRGIFIEVADVNEYLRHIDMDEEIDLTKKQLKGLERFLEDFKVYLKRYLSKQGERIGRFDERNQGEKEPANPDLAPEEADRIARTRKRVARAMRIAKKPRGVQGKSLREVTQKDSVASVETGKELTPEQQAEYLRTVKDRFDALPQLHKGVEWVDVEKALRADLDAMKKLRALDEKGHKMNVFGEENGKLIFASGWENYAEVSVDHRNIAFDLEGQILAEKHGHKPNGNAVSIIAGIMGVKEEDAGNYLADPIFHEQLRKAITVNGYAWLKTDAATRKSGSAFYGNRNGILLNDANFHLDFGSFRAALRVKKA